jgi:hypothetical protein
MGLVHCLLAYQKREQTWIRNIAKKKRIRSIHCKKKKREFGAKFLEQKV